MPTSTFNPIGFVKDRLWESFLDSSNDILKEIQVRTAAKMKNNLRVPSKDLSMRSGNLARDVQGQTKVTSWGLSAGSLGGSNSEVTATRTLTSPNAYLLTDIESPHTLSEAQHGFFKYLGAITSKERGRNDPLAKLYNNMGYAKVARIFGRPYIEEAMQETDWIKKVKENITKRVPDKVTVINIG